MTRLVRFVLCGALFGAMTSPSLAQSCGAWQQSCANAYGGGPGFYSCMGQPGALAACGSGGYGRSGYAVGGNGSCASWRRTCAEMYGGGYQWRQCMHQPNAIYACGG
jgi:hypothetical protein